MVALAERAIACKGWRWLPGMRAEGRRGMSGAWFRVEEELPRLTGEWSEAAPDLTDPATLGCLLALVRSAYGDPRAVICWQGGAQCGYWETFVADSEITADTEAEALVTALECAP